jgi:hypothetical protein
MSWLLVLTTVWVVASTPLAVLIGRSIRLADRRGTAQTGLVAPAFVPDHWSASAAEPR